MAAPMGKRSVVIDGTECILYESGGSEESGYVKITPPQRDQSTPSKRQGLSKRLRFVRFGCFVLTAALGATLIYTFVIRQNAQKDKSLPNVVVRDLNTDIEVNLPIPSDVWEQASDLTITQPDGDTVNVNIKNGRKKRQIEMDTPWEISLVEPGTIGIIGPQVSCLSSGTYIITLMDGNNVLHETSFTIRINNDPSLTGALWKANEGKKHFHCKLNSSCLRSPLDVSGNGGLGSSQALLDVPRECSSTYSKEEGFKYECSGVTDYSALSCMSLITPENVEEGGTSSFEISECTSSPCLHGGTCDVFEMANDYTCTCKTGYQGHDCETDINDCEGNPCKNGATCVDKENDFRCECSPGYEGKTCTIDKNECLSRPCKNGASCIDGQASYTCQCRPGYTGSQCELDIDECASTPCQNSGECIDGNNEYTCVCKSGFIGINCDTALPECFSSPCSSSATCRDTADGFACDCPDGYTGRICDTDIDECASTPCQNSGECIDGNNEYTCVCKSGFIGINCETALPGVSCDTETDTACVENAHCDRDSAVCTCTDPYVTSDDGTHCTYGCSQTCSSGKGEDDAYSISGAVCGSTFKRCVNSNGTSTMYTQHCQEQDVFDPLHCVCVPVSDASWCKPGVAEDVYERTCLADCRDLNE